MKPRRLKRRLLLSLALALSIASGAASLMLGACGPFTDVTDPAFCPFVLEIFYLGITTGTTPTTYDPSASVSRLQMAAFLSRTVDSTLARGSRRAALEQFWTTQTATALGLTTVGVNPELIASDGEDLWVARLSGPVRRVRATDGRLLETWTGPPSAQGVLVAMGRVFVTDNNIPAGALYRIEPWQPPGAMQPVAGGLGNAPGQMAFDGAKIWTANWGPPGSVSIVTPSSSIPWTSTTVTIGTGSFGIVFDGVNMWATDLGSGTINRLDGGGGLLQTVTTGLNPQFPAFDGTNIWVPNRGEGSVSVVRASTGAVLTKLFGNGLASPAAAAFDGRRILVTDPDTDTVSLWKAADLTPIGFVATGTSTGPYGVCSDGINFWVTLEASNRIARF